MKRLSLEILYISSYKRDILWNEHLYSEYKYEGGSKPHYIEVIPQRYNKCEWFGEERLSRFLGNGHFIMPYQYKDREFYRFSDNLPKSFIDYISEMDKSILSPNGDKDTVVSFDSTSKGGYRYINKVFILPPPIRTMEYVYVEGSNTLLLFDEEYLQLDIFRGNPKAIQSLERHIKENSYTLPARKLYILKHLQGAINWVPKRNLPKYVRVIPFSELKVYE